MAGFGVTGDTAVNLQKNQGGKAFNKKKARPSGPRARTKWVTERIASAQAMARRTLSGIN